MELPFQEMKSLTFLEKKRLFLQLFHTITHQATTKVFIKNTVQTYWIILLRMQKIIQQT